MNQRGCKITTQHAVLLSGAASVCIAQGSQICAYLGHATSIYPLLTMCCKHRYLPLLLGQEGLWIFMIVTILASMSVTVAQLWKPESKSLRIWPSIWQTTAFLSCLINRVSFIWKWTEVKRSQFYGAAISSRKMGSKLNNRAVWGMFPVSPALYFRMNVLIHANLLQSLKTITFSLQPTWLADYYYEYASLLTHFYFIVPAGRRKANKKIIMVNLINVAQCYMQQFQINVWIFNQV